MPKPAWLKKKEEEQLVHKYPRCILCKHAGEICGKTNYIDKQHGRMPIYKCKIHPTERFHFKTVACSDYERMI